jgi:mannose-6-phosphate isomerase
MTKLTPVFKEKVWGSTNLEPLFPNSDKKIGEVWLEGVDDLPLLVKFLFTSEKLSVQVHPNDIYGRRHHNSPGKTEMWHVLRAEPGAKIAAGFRQDISAEKLRESSLSGEIEDLLQWFDASPGDTFFIPAGTVHAIGAGLTLCEIQQYSDITYRLYDYGRPRELHLDRAAEVSHLGPYAARQQPKDEVLVDCDYFATSKFRIDGCSKHIGPFSSPHLLAVTAGTGSVAGQVTKAGDVWFLEANLHEIELTGSATFLQIRA